MGEDPTRVYAAQLPGTWGEDALWDELPARAKMQKWKAGKYLREWSE